MSVLVEPKLGSYVTEWEAVQFDGTNFSAVKVLLKHSPWTVYFDLSDTNVVCTQVVQGSVQQWRTAVGEWIVRSPHGRFWFMGEEEFASQFNTWAGKVRS